MKTLVLAVLACAIPAAAADISGSWTLEGDVVGNPVNMTCSFTQSGLKVTGSCNGEAGSTAVTGSVAENQVTFQQTVQSYELTYTGALDATGASMKGEIAVAGVTGTFSATKAAAAPAAPAAAAAAAPAETAKPDLSGNWSFTGDVVGNEINMKCAFKRDGDKYTGTCTYQGLGDSPTAATIAGDKVTFENKVQREQLYDLTYNGTLDASGTAMKGDIAVAGVSGEFSGTKDK